MEGRDTWEWPPITLPACLPPLSPGLTLHAPFVVGDKIVPIIQGWGGEGITLCCGSIKVTRLFFSMKLSIQLHKKIHSGSWFPSSPGAIDHHHGWPGQSLGCSCTGQILSRHAGGATGATRLGQDMSGAGEQILAGQVGDLIQVGSSGKSQGNKQMTRQRRGQL